MVTIRRTVATVHNSVGYPVAGGLVVLVLLGALAVRMYPRWRRRHDIAARLARLRI